MSGISIIENAVLKPTKREVAEQWLGYFEHIGSYRFVDPDGQVGIESLIGFDLDRRLVQMPVTYRSAEFDAEHTLTTMDHSVLGTRYVSNAMGDPVAVREYIRVILEADNGAQRSDGKVSVLDVRGSGNREENSPSGRCAFSRPHGSARWATCVSTAPSAALSCVCRICSCQRTPRA